MRKLFLAAAICLTLFAGSDSRIHDSQRLLSAADRFALLYNWPAAAPLYAQAQSLFEESGDQKNALVARFGYLWATADTSLSPAVSEEVAHHLQDPLVRSDSRLMLRGLVTKAVIDGNTNETAARKSWDQVLRLARNLGDRGWEDRAKAETGQILYMDGDVKSATVMVRDALVSQYLHLDLGAAIYYTAMVGNGFVEAGRPETALQYCNTALRLALVAKDGGFPFLAYQGKARALIALGRNAEAEPVLNGALSQARSEHNFYALAQLLVVAGSATEPGDSSKAIQYLREAVEVSKERGFHHVFAWSTFELASVYRNTGNLDAAESLASNSIEIMRNLEDRYHLPEHLALLAGLEANKGNAEKADQLYSEATDVIDALLVNVNTRQLKGSLIATLSEAYVGHFRLMATKFSNPGRAYEVIEAARGRDLADTLRGDSETLSSADDGTTDAEKEINRVQIALLHETNPDQRQTLLDDLFVEEQLLAPARKTNAALRFNSDRPKPVPIETLQASLRSNEIALEYVLDEPASYCLRITRSSAAVVVLPGGRKHIEDLVEQYLGAVRSRKPEAESSQALFSVILNPALIGQSAKTRLIVVPDGKLHLLPFDGLQDLEGKYILESYVVTYAPSGTVLHLLRKSRSSDHSIRNFLGVGDVVYSERSVSAKPSANTVSRTNEAEDFFDLDAAKLPNLPGSVEEVTSVSRILKGNQQLLLARNATEAAFKAQSLADYRVIHLAVHGLANTKFPDRAALVLGSSPASGEDGLLQVREIRDLPLRADLVTLSACDTGSGKLLGEEGVASLERAFLLAGAKAVIASLWTTDDTYTISLMKRLYQHLADGDDTGAALRQAKLDLLMEFGQKALPFYWAGFTLVGDGSTAIFK